MDSRLNSVEKKVDSMDSGLNSVEENMVTKDEFRAFVEDNNAAHDRINIRVSEQGELLKASFDVLNDRLFNQETQLMILKKKEAL